MSAPERAVAPGAIAGLEVAPCVLDVVELAAYRGRGEALATLVRDRGIALPAFGHVTASAGATALSVRPERWLILTARAAPGAAPASWASACAGVAAVIDLSSALAAFRLAGRAVGETLARGCRVDLDPGAFAPGQALATHAAQVPLTLARLPAGWLLLTPTSTARHFAEWLAMSGAPFGVESQPPCSLPQLLGAPRT